MNVYPRKILLATEVSAEVTPELRAAADVSARTGAPLRLVHVGRDIPPPAHWNDPSPADLRFQQRGGELLNEQIAEIEARGGTVADSGGVPGSSPGEEIVKLTRAEDVGLVVVGDRGLGRFRYAARASIPAHVVRDAYCPVMVVRGGFFSQDPETLEFSAEASTGGSKFPRRVLLATDGSEDASLAVLRAVEIARVGSELHVVHVVESASPHPDRGRAVLDAEAGRIEEAGAIVAETHLREGPAVEEILKLGDEIDAQLIVVGSWGLGSMRGLAMGTVAGGVVSSANCPVMMVRGDRPPRPLVDPSEVGAG